MTTYLVMMIKEKFSNCSEDLKMNKLIVSVVLIMTLVFSSSGIILAVSLLLSVQNVYSYTLPTIPAQNGNNNSTKVIILAFDDSPKSQFTLAKPFLDKYGFKGSFFVVCNYVNNATTARVYNYTNNYMTWQDIKILQKEGHDIQSHSMTHTSLDNKSKQNLIYEIGGSKQCLLEHVGINSTIFAYPASTGHSNATVVNVVAKYYNLARTGDAPLVFLHCNGYKKDENNNCAPFNKTGELTYENRYDIRNWSHRPKLLPQHQQQPNANISYDNSQMYNQFVKEANLEENYNKNGCINAIPIVVYHKFIMDRNHRYLPDKSYTDVSLFSAEMKYLHDNGFNVLKMSDIGYNQSNNYLYIKEPFTNDNTALAKNC